MHIMANNNTHHSRVFVTFLQQALRASQQMLHCQCVGARGGLGGGGGALEVALRASQQV
jgi:hypothetical protein